MPAALLPPTEKENPLCEGQKGLWLRHRRYYLSTKSQGHGSIWQTKKNFLGFSAKEKPNKEQRVSTTRWAPVVANLDLCGKTELIEACWIAFGARPLCTSVSFLFAKRFLWETQRHQKFLFPLDLSMPSVSNSCNNQVPGGRKPPCYTAEPGIHISIASMLRENCSTPPHFSTRHRHRALHLIRSYPKLK